MILTIKQDSITNNLIIGYTCNQLDNIICSRGGLIELLKERYKFQWISCK